jgi:hypothetical protein
MPNPMNNIPDTVVLVGEAIAGESVKARKELETLIRTLNASTFDVADLLHKVRKNGWYRPDFDTFGEYVKSLDIKQRKAEYLEKIVDVMEEVGYERNTYEPLGVAKLREITSLDPNVDWTNPSTGEVTPMRDFITEFVDKGLGMSLADIKQHVRTLKGLVGVNDIINRTFGWTRQAVDETIDPAIRLAKNAIGSTGRDAEGNAIEPSDSKAIELILADFLANPANNVTLEPDDENGS